MARGEPRLVVVAKGCIEVDVERLRREKPHPGFSVFFDRAVLEKSGGRLCGELVAMVGPKGGVREVFLRVEGRYLLLSRPMVSLFRAEEVMDENLYRRIAELASKKWRRWQT